jgi:hypothetical protein
MTKEEMIAEIHRMDPSYQRLGINLDKYSDAEIEKHYLRKKNAPTGVKQRSSGGWYTSFTPRTRATTIERSDGYEEVQYVERPAPKPKQTEIDLQGFSTFKKEDLFKESV